MVLLTKEEFEAFASSEFPNKMFYWGENYCYIQAGNKFKDGIHYEYLENAVYFHIECMEWRGLRDFLRENIHDERINREKWQGNAYKSWKLLRDIQSADDVKSALKEISEIFEPYIIKYEEGKLGTESPKVIDALYSPAKLVSRSIEPDANNSGIDNEKKQPVTLITASIKDVFSYNLTIPDYQRAYCWEDKQVVDLWNSISDISKGTKYHLGAIILQRKTDESGLHYDVIDGQQRLVTLTLILRELQYNNQLPLLFQSFESEEARRHIQNNKAIIQDIVVNNCVDPTTLVDSIIFSVLILNESSLDLAYTFFSNQNSKGVPLTDYDLLKAHHLRYLVMPEQAEHLAKRWNKLASETLADGSLVIEQALGRHLLRIRKWMRKNGFNEGKERVVKDEFSAAPIMPGIPPFGEKFYFYEKIQGGSHFFAYSEHFIELYKEFSSTPQVRLLRDCLQWESHWRYEDIIESLLFGYYTKFGKQYLSEALLCITGVMAQHRYSAARALSYKIREHAQQSELIMMIDQASSPTFFLAEALPLCKVSGKGKENIQGRFYKCLQELFKNPLIVVTDKSFIEYRNKEYYE